MPRIISGLIILAVIGAFLYYNWYFAVNFPYQDDFLLIQFIQTITAEDVGPVVFIKELFRTFNDHKAVVPRLVALLDYERRGYLSFAFFLKLVQFNLLYIFYFVYRQFKKTKLPVYYFFPVPFLFFHPLYHEISGWALNGMQHTFLTAFTVSAIGFALSCSYPGLYLSLICCTLATFTHGNGIISFPAVVFTFLFFKDFRKAGWTVLCMFTALGIYLLGYESGQSVNTPTNVASFFSYLLGFIGSEMSLWGDPVFWSAIWGLVIALFVLFIVVRILKTYYRPGPVTHPEAAGLLSLFVFIFLTGCVVAFFRSWTDSMVASRFQLYAALSTCILYLLLLMYVPLFRKMVALVPLTLLSIFYWAYSYYSFTDIVADKRTTYMADIYNWSYQRDMFSVEKSIVRNAMFYMEPAYRNGIFRLPAPFVNPSSIDSMFNINALPKESYRAFVRDWKVQKRGQDSLSIITNYFFQSDFRPEPKKFDADRFLVLQNVRTRIVHLIQANPKKESRRTILMDGEYYKSGFDAFLRSTDLENGVYNIAILDRKRNGQRDFYVMDKLLIAIDGKIMLR